MKIHNCGWCGAETKPIYRLKDGKFLCLGCAEKHFNYVNDKMEQHIQEVRNGLTKKKNKLEKLKQEMCSHNHLIDTGYGTVNDDKTLLSLYCCEDCGKTLYR